MSILTKEFTLDRVDQSIRFSITEDTVGLVLEILSEKPNTNNFILYDDDNSIQGQLFSRVTKSVIFLGYDFDTTSPYSLPLKSTKNILITNFNTSDYMKNNFVKTYIKLLLFNDKEEYRAYFDKEYINLDNTSDYKYFIDRQTNDLHLTNFDEEKIYKDGLAWYSGDPHTHTNYSDGNLLREENIKNAKEKGLDFIAATDHNIVPLNWVDGDFLVIPGIEITSEVGHFNLLFTKRNPIENENIMEVSDIEKTKDILEYSKDLGVLSINHPFSEDDGMKILDLDLSLFDCIEIINDPYEHPYEKTYSMALKAWSTLWNKGLDTCGIAGSDIHFRQEEKSIGYPRNYILANNLSAKELKKSILDRKVSFSMNARTELLFTDNEINDEFRGKNAAGVYFESDRVELQAHFYGQESGIIEWIVDGEIVDFEISRESTRVFSDCNWIRADFRDKYNRYIGSTNPVRIRKTDIKKDTNWKDVLDSIDGEIKVVVFDKDGTLIEFSDMWLHATRNYLINIGMDKEERSKCEQALGISGDEFLDNSVLSAGTVEDAFNIIKEFKSEIPATVEGFEGEMMDYIDKNNQEIIQRSDIKTLFEGLQEKGIRIGVLSNDNHNLIVKSLEILNLEKYVEIVIGADDSIPKPYAKSFIRLKNFFKVKASQMAYVGDSNVDLLHGNYYGKFIAYPSSVSDRETLERYSDYVIKDLTEILDIV